MFKLVVGLGNPGKAYLNTRHNIGAEFAAQLAFKYALNLKLNNKFHGFVADWSVNNSDGKLLVPNTFMNLSGAAVAAVANFYKILPEHILIAHDELDLPVGAVRLKQGGGTGGHNGLRDICAKLGGKDFWRLRLGIGHPGHSSQVSNYVLSKPPISEQEILQTSIEQVLACWTQIASGEISSVMQILHSKK